MFDMMKRGRVGEERVITVKSILFWPLKYALHNAKVVSDFWHNNLFPKSYKFNFAWLNYFICRYVFVDLLEYNTLSLKEFIHQAQKIHKLKSQSNSIQEKI